MKLTKNTLRAQLEAAHLALESIGRERVKWRASATDLKATLEIVQAEANARDEALQRNLSQRAEQAEGALKTAEAEHAELLSQMANLKAALESAEADQAALNASGGVLRRDLMQRAEQAEGELKRISVKHIKLCSILDMDRQQLLSAKRKADHDKGGLRGAYEVLLGALADVTVRLSTTQSERDALANVARTTKDLADEMQNQLVFLQSSFAGREQDFVTAQRLLETQLASIYRSTSWRVTWPLRVVGELPRRLRSGLKVGKLRLTAELKRVAFALRGMTDWTQSLPGRLKRAARAALRSFASRALNWVLNLLTRVASSWRLRFGRPRTMWGATPILTLPLLAGCDRLLGLRSESLVFTVYHTTSRFDINLRRICETVYRKYPSWAYRFHKIVLRLALIRYDVFNLFCDRGLLEPTRRMEISSVEMKAIRHYGRRLYTYTYGADVRTREVTLALGRFNLCMDCPEPKRYCICDDVEGGENIQRIRKYATAMMAMGDMLAYTPGARNLHFWPIDTNNVYFVGCDWRDSRSLRVAHAPNHPQFKGTHHLLNAIEKLQSEGFAIELVRVQGVPNSEVIALFKSCDIVVDQLIAGFHGYTALEAMALGKPVLCYLRNPSMAIDAENCPIINVRPDTIYSVLRHCLEGRFDLAALGQRSRSYVEHYYSLQAVAVRLGRLYLETAGFPDRINRKIVRKITTLQRNLPELLTGSPPVSWEVNREVNLALPSDEASMRQASLAGAPIAYF